MVQSLFKTLSPLAIVGLEGPRLTSGERSLLAEAPPAGVILFARNIEGARQLERLVKEIEEVFAGAGARPPIIAADHEGGIVSVLSRAIGTPPSQMAAGRAGAALVRRLFEENARRMRACGVNMMLGPVADVNSEPLNPIVGTRSFGERVETVSACVSAAVAGAKAAGVLTCLKHFPGHGPTRADSHVSLPVLSATLDELRRSDLLPFARGIEAGADSIMVAHVAVSGRTHPASLDREVVTGVLREELGFGGVIMTDALEMVGAREIMDRAGSGVPEDRKAAPPRSAWTARSLAQACELALRAGNDILLFSKPAAEVAEELDACGGTTEGDDFWRDEFANRLALSGVRIDGLTSMIRRPRDIADGQEFDDGIYREVARSSIRIAARPESIEPHAAGQALRIMFVSEMEMFGRPAVTDFIDRVAKEVTRAGWSTSRLSRPDWVERLGETTRAANVEAAQDRDRRADLGAVMYSFGPDTEKAPAIVVLMNRRPLDAAAVKELCAGADVVVVAEWPYAADLLEPGQRAIVTYGVYDAAAELVCSMLLSRPSC